MTSENNKTVIDTLLLLSIPQEICEDLVKYFAQIRNELQSQEVEKPSVGKFVETIVQMFQSLDPHRKANYDKSVKDVDMQLRNYESKPIPQIPNDSRIAILRVARAIYCLRSKRSIVHKNDVEPNIFDLRFIYNATQWIMTELIRIAAKVNVGEAKRIIENIQKPVIPHVEEIMGRQLVLRSDLKAEDEILLILYAEYFKGMPVSRKFIGECADRFSPASVTKALKKLHKQRFIEGDRRKGYLLTQKGIKRSKELLQQLSYSEK